ncbi:hypothetical protein MBLNU459_g4449t1 [Dothideomycetes sp. NU459]
MAEPHSDALQPHSHTNSAPQANQPQPTSKNIKLPPQYKPRKSRTQVAIACQSCRKRRAKCSGSSPCTKCTEEKRECIFDGKRGLQQRNQDLRTREKALSKVFNILRDGNSSSSIAAIQQLAREDSDIESFTESITKLDEQARLVTDEEAAADRDVDHLATRTRSDKPHSGTSLSARGSQSSSKCSSESHFPSSSSTSGDISREPLEEQEYDSSSAQKRQSSAFRSPEFLELYAHMISWLNESGSGFGNLPLSSAIRTNGYPSAVQDQQMLNFQFPAHSILPLHGTEDEILGKVYTSFRDAALQMMASGTPAPKVLGPPGYVELDLFFRSREPQDIYNVDNFACEILKTRPDDQEIFVKLACVPMVAYLMRWMLMPTPENYARVPELIRPLPSQRFIPHSPVLDLAPHPAIRDAQMRAYNRDWLMLENQTKAAPSVNWPHTLAEAITADPVSGRSRLTPEFERHALDPENWTFKKDILDVFPELDKLGARIASLDMSDER